MKTTLRVRIQRDTLAEFCRRHHIRRLALFGSVLRPEFRSDSDVDVLVEFERGHTPGLAFFDIEEELSRLLGRKVDLNTPQFLGPRFREKVQAEAELLETPHVISLRLATVFGMSPRMRLDLLVNHFVYAAVTDGYIVIFEKDFKRNYIHIRDVADCFIYAVKNAEQMSGRPYNVGLDNANLSKAELAEKIRKYVPELYIHFAEIGSDPDKRNYIVSNQRLREAGFVAKRSLDDGIQELIRGYRMMPHQQMKNV